MSKLFELSQAQQNLIEAALIEYGSKRSTFIKADVMALIKEMGKQAKNQE